MSSPTASAAPPAAPQIYEATLALDGSGIVTRGNPVTQAQAEARRMMGLDIVVCGPDEGANWQVARAIEQAINPAGQPPKSHGPHGPAPNWLPHWQQRDTKQLPGHSFYETQGAGTIPPRRAR
jgi:hypothetical protein